MSMPNIISDPDSYVLDYFEEKPEIPALTEKNSQFIEAVVSLDSNYKKEFDTVEPAKNFKLSEHASDSKGKYCGSTKYWFKEMENPTKYDYKEALLGAIISIDRANSTHLGASVDGRETMQKRIVGKCDDLDALKKSLKSNKSVTDHNNLVYILSEAVDSRKGENFKRYNLSFATKFCVYACKELHCGDPYSIYDNVVAKNLPIYVEMYLGKKRNKSYYLMNSKDTIDDRVRKYEKYNDDIKTILNMIKKEGNIQLNREKLDHIIWYGLK